MFKFVVIFSDRLCYVDAYSFEDCLNKVACDFPDLQLLSISKTPYFDSKYKDGCFEIYFYKK